MSGYLETNRGEYYERLKGISQAGDWSGWIEFFLKAIIAQATDNAEKVRSILALDAIFDRPIFKTTDFAVRSGIPTKQTAMGLLRLLQKAGILKVLFEGSGSRPATLAFPELINIAEGRQVV